MENNRVIQAMDYAIDFMEAAISRLSIFCLMSGFIMGTIAILSPQVQLSGISWFNLTWAIVQAFALDGLFLGVLFLLRDKWKAIDKPTRTWYVFIVILLGTVAALVNTTLAYQELHQTASVVDAMNQLGISQEAFAYTRAILIVLVTALVCTLPRKRMEDPTEKLDLTVSEVVEQAVSAEVGTLRVELTEVKTLLYTIIEVQPPLSEGRELPSPSTYDRIKEYMITNPGVKNKDIISALGVPESTVKSYAAKVRKEIVPDRITDSIPAIV